MLHELAARRIGPVIAGIALRRRPEELLPSPPALELIGVLDDVAGLVAQNAHAFRPGAAFDVDDLLPLQLHQAWVREIERNGNAGRALRGEPLARDPGVRAHANATLRELAVESVEAVLEPRPFDLDLQVLEAKFQQLLVGQ